MYFWVRKAEVLRYHIQIQDIYTVVWSHFFRDCVVKPPGRVPILFYSSNQEETTLTLSSGHCDTNVTTEIVDQSADSISNENTGQIPTNPTKIISTGQRREILPPENSSEVLTDQVAN